MATTGWIGQKLGRYQIEEQLGQGGMATVFKAVDPNLRRDVAIKVIHPHLSRDPQFVRRFEAEATAVAQLRHPNIVQVYDFDHSGEIYYIVFEFVDGETLQERLRRTTTTGSLPSQRETVRIGTTIAGALNYAHEEGLVHRDIKPANVMLNSRNEPILTDFGIAKIAGGTQHTAAGAVLGTARYMSPEQVKGERIDSRTDVYSLGVMLYELVGGRPPYDGDSAMTVLLMHVNDPVPDVKTVRPDVWPGLSTAITRSMAKNPSDRYRTAAHLAQALINAMPLSPPAAVTVPEVRTPTEPQFTGQASHAQPPRTAAQSAQRVRSAAPRPASPPEAARAQPAPRKPSAVRSGRWWLFGAGVLLLVLLCAGAAVVFALLSGDDNIEPSPVAGIVDELTATVESLSTAVLSPTAAEGVETSAPAEETATDEAAPTGSAPELIPTLRPTSTPTWTPVPPTLTSTPPPTLAPTHTPPQPTATTAPTTLSVRINSIEVQDGRYIVAYETFGYQETLPGQHVHFFFNTVQPANAGVPGSGPWILYGGPRPFTQYTVADRPGGASQICALVANPDHSIQLGSGNCLNLP